jgi:cyclophilin family peptidyl-prolyl cis-trans isomerase
MPKRSRERHLAKLAARRQAERAASRRRRKVTISVVAGALVLILFVIGAGLVLAGGDSGPPAASSSASTSPSASEDPCSHKTPPGADEKKPSFSHAPPVTIDPTKTYTATIATSCGTFEVDLLASQATDAVNSFVFLARKGFYDGLTWHRLVQGFVIQGGDPKGDGTGGPGYEISVTVTKGVSFDSAGVVAYAHASKGGNGSQFFVTLAPTPDLDPPQGKYTIFGTVAKGQKVVDRIGSQPTAPSATGEQSAPVQPVYIDTITIHES